MIKSYFFQITEVDITVDPLTVCKPKDCSDEFYVCRFCLGKTKNKLEPIISSNESKKLSKLVIEYLSDVSLTVTLKFSSIYRYLIL